MVPLKGLFVLLVASETLGHIGGDDEVNRLVDSSNYTTTDSFIIFHEPSEAQQDDSEVIAKVLVDATRNDTNISHLKTSVTPSDWNGWKTKLKFPTTSSDKQYRMANLHLDRGTFVFNFLRKFLSFIQPYDVPTDLLVEAIENRINTSKLISESLHLEAVLIAVVGVCCVLCCVIPSVELWLACRPIRKDYQPSQHPTALTFFLAFFVCILGYDVGMITMTVSNETVSASVEKFPAAVEAALQDFNDYHSSTTIQLRKCLSRSLDVASEAVLEDLDNIEDLLGRPVQTELSNETGLDIALDALIDLLNGKILGCFSGEQARNVFVVVTIPQMFLDVQYQLKRHFVIANQRVSNTVESLLKDGENISNVGKQLNREIDDLRRNLEGALKACTGQDRPLCSTIDTSGLRLSLRIDQFVKDDRLLRLHDFRGENLTETIRQARGEYLYIPQHIARNTLEVRNQIRREINKMRGRIFDEARSMEASNSELVKQLELARRLAEYAMPYAINFEHIRWLICIGAVLCVLLIWLLLFGAVCCSCSSEDKVRPTLLCGVFMACLGSFILWGVFMITLIVSSHAEMLICRPLHDLNYSTIEAILETKTFLGKRLSVSLKDLFKNCRENEPGYPAFGLGSTMKLEQLTAYWTWSSFSRIALKLKIELKALKIFTPYLQRQLQNLLYAAEMNLTEHRIMIQGRILNKDLEALSDQLDNVVAQMSDRLTARSLETIVANMQDLVSTRLKPLKQLQGMLLYKLAALELQLQPLQRQVNQSLSHLKTIQYYIDNQGDKIAQLRTKVYVDQLANYLDQWRSHVLSEMGNGLTKCRPLWDILEGMKLLLCSHFVGNLSGYWFSTFLCAIILIASAPIAHILSLVYKKLPGTAKTANIQPTRPEEPQAEVNDRETWNAPEPPPPPPQEGWQ